MKRWVRYSLVVYIGLLYAGFLHQPGGFADDEPAPPAAPAQARFPHELRPSTWARPAEHETATVITAERDTAATGEAKKKAPRCFTPFAVPPMRNPFE